jgi:hypothetical protein
MFDAASLNGAQGLIEKRAAQVPVVVGLGGLLSRSRLCRTSHTPKILTMSVDGVNIQR